MRLFCLIVLLASCDGTAVLSVPDMAIDASPSGNLPTGADCPEEASSFALCIANGCSQPSDAPTGSIYVAGCCYRREWVLSGDAGRSGVCCHKYETVASDAGPSRLCFDCGDGYRCSDL